MPNRAWSLLAVALALAAPPRLAAQTEIAVGDVKVRLTGRVQVQFNTTSVDQGDLAGLERIPFSTFETRRVRFGVEVEIDDWISGEIEPEYALGDVTLRNAYLNFAFDDRFELRAGQFKKPFSLINLTSATQIIPIERGVRIRGLADAYRIASAPDPISDDFIDLGGNPIIPEEQNILSELRYIGYGLGAMAHGEFSRFHYGIGIFNGAGANRLDDTDGKSFAGRIAFVPWKELPLVLGISGAYQEFLFERRILDDRVEVEGDGAALEIDAEWGSFRRPGLHLVLEGALGDNIVDDGAFLAGQGIVAWFHPVAGGRLEGVEPLFRASYADVRRDGHRDSGLLVTPGLNLYFFGRNRFMLNWDIFFPRDERFDTENALRAQAQLYF